MHLLCCFLTVSYQSPTTESLFHVLSNAVQTASAIEVTEPRVESKSDSDDDESDEPTVARPKNQTLVHLQQAMLASGVQGISRLAEHIATDKATETVVDGAAVDVEAVPVEEMVGVVLEALEAVPHQQVLQPASDCIAQIAKVGSKVGC